MSGKSHAKSIGSTIAGSLLKHLSFIVKGVFVGFGAIMPGISGGTLCVAFGMYHILIDALTKPVQAFRQHGKKIITFLLGWALGFFGLAGLAGWLMAANAQAVTCVFIGFILGTVPDLWKEAGLEGRTKASWVALGAAFAVMLTLLLLLRMGTSFTMQPDLIGFLFCGLMWGASFIVPGLSSSTLLLFFGLYQPMLEGISSFSLPVLLPLAAGMGICLITLPKGVKALYTRWYSIASHAVLGIVLASTASIFPLEAAVSAASLAGSAACIAGGAVASYLAVKACERLEPTEEETNSTTGMGEENN